MLAREVARLRGAPPAQVYAETAQVAGFLQAPTSPAPDAKALVESEQISAVVGRCTNVISEDCAQVPLKLFDVTTANRPRELFDHPAILLWRHINPVETPTVYLQQTFADLLCEGNHFAVLDRDGRGTPLNMIRLPPEQVKVIPHRTRIVAGYTWSRPDGLKETYTAEEVMHIRTRNPNPIYRGLGLLVRARDQIRFEHQLRSWKENQIKNGVPTSLIINVKRMFSNEQEWERFRQETWDRMRGIKNAGKPMFVRADDVDVKIIDRPKEDEVAYINCLKYTRNEIAMLFGVPPSRLSDYSESFRANASEQGRTYWQDTIMSWHRLFLDYLNSVFIPKWFSADVGADMRPRIAFAYDYSQVRALALSARDMASVNEILIRNAMRSPAEATISMGDAKPDDPKAEALYMNGRPLGEEQLGPAAAGTVPSGGEIRPEGDTEPEEEERAAAGSGVGKAGNVTPPRPSLRAVPSDPVDEGAEARRMAEQLEPLIGRMVTKAAVEEIELSGLLGSFDSKDPAVLEAVRTQSILVSEAVTHTTAVEVRRALAFSIEKGYDPDQMRKAIRNTFRAARADWRLDRVARTEAHQAHSSGGYHGLRQNQVRRKKWITSTTGDTRQGPAPRPDHLHMDGMVVGIDDPFVDPASGARLMFPGDVANAKSGADVINCNCVIVADFSDLEEQSLRRAVDSRGAVSQKAATRRRFENAMTVSVRRFLVGMEERAIAELNKSLGQRSVTVSYPLSFTVTNPPPVNITGNVIL